MTKLFVGNLPFSVDDQTLQELFAQDGRVVESVKTITDRETGRSRGFCFVEMGSAADAEAAITALDGYELEGRALRVSEARERERRDGGGGGGRGGNRNGGGGRGGSRGGGGGNRW